ncbi:glucose dehydrogenase [FAD, quinone]-like isoform X2 [Sitodiplosis mosellana]|uniref:glucose dehydrogenase [FAD, quinone]-like isoform X2 n=1 Tax=Sitodiplosis mosellana TaxID=263140 RepID=UPI00244518F9|nr:glucose dehydrogenase [FAD, quinone]-like isoform X2 [Sitodiplosis mosellana]
MSSFSSQCSAQSVGPANHLVTTLIQTLLAVQCSISPPEMWPKDYGETALKNDEYDFVVIGSGSSGAVVASRLSEIEDWKVLLLEAGGTPPLESEIPGFQYTMLNSEYDWQFRTESDTACLSYPKGCLRPRGKMLGGTSSINSMLYVRGHKHDFDKWSSYGNPGWDYDSVLHYFKKSENNQNTDFVNYKNGMYHSDKGPMKVDSFSGEDLPYNQVYLKALSEIGIETIDNINADKIFGAVDVQGNFWNGRRHSTAKAFLIPASKRKNLHIIYNADVQKILIDENNRATGVEFVYKGERKMKAAATKEVVLSAGSIMSPKILMNSGVGPKDHLEELRIQVKSDLRVGENLYEHIFVRLFFSFSELEPIDPIHAKLDSIYNFAIHNTGPLANGFQVQATAFINTFNGTEYPDMQLSYLHLPQDVDIQRTVISGFEPKIKEFFNEKLKKFEVGCIFAELVQPKSRGYIKLSSSSPYDKPIMRPKYLTDKDDVQALFRAIKRVLGVLNTKAYKEKGARLLRLPLDRCDHLEYMSDEYWLCYIRYISYPTNHTVGSSKMGNSTDPEAVVDPRLRVRGIEGLRQIDGGIMPSPVSGNTNAACIMIGEKGADLIKEDHSRTE